MKKDEIDMIDEELSRQTGVGEPKVNVSGFFRRAKNGIMGAIRLANVLSVAFVAFYVFIATYPIVILKVALVPQMIVAVVMLFKAFILNGEK